jgi:hypothetical protein
MASTQEGFRRLGIALGSVTATIYLFASFIAAGSAGSSSVAWIPNLLIGTAVCWCVGWGIVRVAWWVWRGFAD